MVIISNGSKGKIKFVSKNRIVEVHFEMKEDGLYLKPLKDNFVMNLERRLPKTDVVIRGRLN